METYGFFRYYMDIFLLPLSLIVRGYNLISDPELWMKIIPEDYRGLVDEFILYFKNYYLRSTHFIKECNQYRMKLRSNNILESLNGRNNKYFGKHPYLFQFIFKLAALFANSTIEYQQYMQYGVTNDKRNVEILKDQCLNLLWDFIDVHHKDNDILYFLRQTGIVMKAKKTTLLKLLKNHQKYKL